MKISGKFILKVAGTLTVISLVVAALLGLVDSVTRDKINAIEAENTRIAMSAVVPEGSEFTDKLDITDAVAEAASAQGGKISELYGVTNGGAEAGYVMKISASGSQGTIVMMVGVDANKAITGISVVSHSETSGIGTKVVGNEPNTAGVPVVLWDERRTTVDAHNILFSNGKNAKKRKKVVDAVAASLMLEGYLTRKRLEAQRHE